jgi:hypothetical protein
MVNSFFLSHRSPPDVGWVGAEWWLSGCWVSWLLDRVLDVYKFDFVIFSKQLSSNRKQRSTFSSHSFCMLRDWRITASSNYRHKVRSFSLLLLDYPYGLPLWTDPTTPDCVDLGVFATSVDFPLHFCMYSFSNCLSSFDFWFARTLCFLDLLLQYSWSPLLYVPSL